jgi:cleavage stimulation factor subunit 3
MASENPHGDEHAEGAAWGEGGDMAPSMDVSNSSELQEQHQMADQFDESAEIGDFGAGSPQEYDPAGPSAASAVPIPSPTAVRPNPTEPKQTIGGFIVGDDSDEEEDESARTAPVNTSTTSLQVPSASSGNQAAPQDRSPTEHVTNGVAQATSTSFPLVNAQMDAHDLVASLEKRVKEDPRGEVDSWLALIDEYRRRNKPEETRTAYERFLKFFPQSVRFIFSLSLNSTKSILFRRLLGQSGSSLKSTITTSPKPKSSLAVV